MIVTIIFTCSGDGCGEQAVGSARQTGIGDGLAPIPPAGWTKDGGQAFCPQCQAKRVTALVPEEVSHLASRLEQGHYYPPSTLLEGHRLAFTLRKGSKDAATVEQARAALGELDRMKFAGLSGGSVPVSVLVLHRLFEIFR